jgi:hypothetical protein
MAREDGDMVVSSGGTVRRRLGALSSGRTGVSSASTGVADVGDVVAVEGA